MKKSGLALIVMVFLFMLVLSACSTGSPAATEPASAGGAQVTQATDKAAACSASAGVDVAALINEKLQNHHSVDRIYSASHTREEWNATLDRMIGYGANISQEEKQVIIDYLLCLQQ